MPVAMHVLSKLAFRVRFQAQRRFTLLYNYGCAVLLLVFEAEGVWTWQRNPWKTHALERIWPGHCGSETIGKRTSEAVMLMPGR